ncbi:MAG: HAD-IIIA family hydrolase [Ignavibacteria bacterium]|nr:HAD-IIIA family hydrolase [Ignavibacteria bacterium]
MNKAIFFDRDGVLLKLVFHKEYNEYGPPLRVEQLIFQEDIFNTLKKVKKLGYLYFLISNQPDFAKGRIGIENLRTVHNVFDRNLKCNGIFFEDYYYCYHHPDGIIPEYTLKCNCRKPGNANVEKAIKKYDIDRNFSWFIGDRSKDIECGRSSGLKTILFESRQTKKEKMKYKPDYVIKEFDVLFKIISKFEIQ